MCYSVTNTATVNNLLHISLHSHISISLDGVLEVGCLGQKVYTFKILIDIVILPSKNILIVSTLPNIYLY